MSTRDRLIVIPLCAIAFVAMGCEPKRSNLVESSMSREVGSKPYSVMSFNIRYGTAKDGENRWEKRDHLVLDILRNRGGDVICLQEALSFQLEQVVRALPEFGMIGVGRADGQRQGEHAAILYDKSRLTELENGTFWLSETPEVVASKSWGNSIPRICTWARFEDRASRERFYVYNLHLDHQSQPSRKKSAMLVLERIPDRGNDDAVIVAGDSNAGEQSAEMLFFKGTNGRSEMDVQCFGVPELVDTFRAIHAEATDVGTFNAFKGEVDGAKIDYVLVDDRWEVLDAAILRDNEEGRYPSDHFPVTCRLKLSPRHE